MGLFDSIDSIFDPFSGSLGSGSLLDFGGELLGGFLGNQFSQQSVTPTTWTPNFPVYQPPVVQPTAAGSVPLAARAAAAGIAAWSARFPSLWQALQKMRANGSAVTVEKLWRQLKQWGPQTMTTIIGAAAVADLISYKTTHKSRRMNPANTKALRRSLRRLKSFDRLACRVSQQLSSAARPKRRHCK